MGNGETKSEKFKRLATLRVANALKKIELIGNLSSSSYEYSNEEVDKMFAALQAMLDKVKSRFKPKQKDDSQQFSL